jgi:hypothetical protein
MVYVQRDEAGRLLRVESAPFEGMSGMLAVESEELERWLNAQEEVRRRLDDLQSSDREMIRVLEDVVGLLVERDIIRFTDLPEKARVKLDERAVARAEIEALRDLVKLKQS